jgi:hypothetical protein
MRMTKACQYTRLTNRFQCPPRVSSHSIAREETRRFNAVNP